MIHTICIHGVLRDTLGIATYGALVTRPTGAAVRGRIREVIARTPVPTTWLDFGSVDLMDFSCADEVVAKLLQDPDPDHARYVVLSGLTEEMCDAIDSVLSRQHLAVVGCPREETSPTPLVLGWANPAMRTVFTAVQDHGPGETHSLSTRIGWSVEKTADALQSLALRRLIHASAGHFRPLVAP